MKYFLEFEKVWPLMSLTSFAIKVIRHLSNDKILWESDLEKFETDLFVRIWHFAAEFQSVKKNYVQNILINDTWNI